MKNELSYTSIRPLYLYGVYTDSFIHSLSLHFESWSTTILLVGGQGVEDQLNDLHVTSFLGLYKEDVYQL